MQTEIFLIETRMCSQPALPSLSLGNLTVSQFGTKALIFCNSFDMQADKKGKASKRESGDFASVLHP